MSPTRRTYLTALATTTVLTVAGCSSSESPTETPAVTTTPGVSEPTTDGTTDRPETDTRGGDLPSYADRAAYTEESLSLEATEECSLGATLTLPEGDGAVPGVVIVHGSGPNDRDGTVGPLQPYRDLAVGLASRGIAVLRYDKRTFACQQSIDPTAFTIDDVVTEDVLTAVSRLREQPRVDREDIVVVGHSLGGALAPRVASRDGGLAGIALLAANARPLPDLIVDQTRYALERDGELTDAERRRLEQTRALAERLRTADIGDEEVLAGGGEPFWRSLAEYDQVETATAIETPILLAQGERDRQVTVADDLSRWRDTLGDRTDVRIHTYPGLNHYFVDGAGALETGGQPEDGFVAESLIADLADWIEGVVEAA
ncbi:alpha/beta hydrolase family protein [Halapricum salinum]|nr:alpha/beta fold hydrolase [Halapricum salinum]